MCAEVEPSPTDYKLRQNFYEAVKVARTKGTKVRVTSIYDEVISKVTFFTWYVMNPKKMAFMFRPVVKHEQYYQAIFNEGLRKLFIYVRNHDLDPKTIASFSKIIEKAGDRIIGPVAQRIQMHQKQEVTHTASLTSERAVDSNDPISLQAQIEEMQQKVAKLNAKQAESPVIEIEPE